MNCSILDKNCDPNVWNLSFLSNFISLIKRKILASAHWNESVPGSVAGKVRRSKGMCEHKATCHSSCHLGWQPPPSGLIRNFMALGADILYFEK